VFRSRDDKGLCVMDPNLELARERAAVAHQILIKFKEIGLSEDHDEDLARLCTDLADLWSSQNSYNQLLMEFLENETRDWKFIAEHLTDIKSHIDHISWHIRSVKDPIERMAVECYEASKND